MIEEQTPPTAGLGQKRRFGPRPATVRFTLHCRHAAALPRTGGLGQNRNSRPLLERRELG